MTLPLICPEHGAVLRPAGEQLWCEHDHGFPVVQGVPVLLRGDVAATIDVMAASFERARSGQGAPYFVDTVGLAPHEKLAIERELAAGRLTPDPVASWLVAATSGFAYEHAIGQLRSYPIPDIPLEHGGGRSLLDVGCSWGRWSIAAAQKGWDVVGIDPSLGALLAAQRVAAQLGVRARFVCADARYLPFAREHFDAAYSYSVLQHFPYEDANRAIEEIGRVLKPGGSVKIQLAHRFGGRALFHQLRRRLRPAQAFDVRYWSIPAMRRTFERAVGSTKVEAEAFGGLGLLFCDYRHMSAKGRVLVTVSEGLRRIGRVVSPLTWLADSTFVEAQKPGLSR
jgi:SAM-dependent methyltransferase